MNVLPSALAMTEQLVSDLFLNYSELENWVKNMKKKQKKKICLHTFDK